MGYEPSTIECDGEHTRMWNDKGEIESGDKLYCQTCFDKLKERIAELEEELKNSNDDVEDREARVEQLEGQEKELNKEIEKLNAKIFTLENIDKNMVVK